MIIPFFKSLRIKLKLFPHFIILFKKKIKMNIWIIIKNI